MKTALTALLAICLCWAVGCGKDEPAADPRAGDDERGEPAADKPLPKDFESLKALAEQGVAKAQHKLGWMYDFGKGVPKNDKEAVKWYRKAAEQGDAEAQTNLGYMFSNGEGVPVDDKEAAKWYRKAAEQGYASAQLNLGYMYFYGRGVLKDFREAVKWFRKAAEQGNAQAQRDLGLVYAKGEGAGRNFVTAYVWWNIAVTNGHQTAKGLLSQLEKIMTADQIAKAEQLSREMIKKNPKLLK